MKRIAELTSSAIQVPSEGAVARPIAPLGEAAKRRLVHVRELDGVRGIAALLVFFHHVCYTSVRAQGWGRGVHLLFRLSAYGYVGVDLFFVLSGFLITSLLIEDRQSPRYYHDFYWKRALRILPLYLVCLAGILIFYPAAWRSVVVSALFVANFATVFHVGSSGPFWTLAIEEQFYLIWPTVVRRRAIGVVSRWAIGLGLGAFVLRLVAASVGHYNYHLTFLHCDGLAAGALLACRFERWSFPAVIATRERITWIAAILGGVVFFLISFNIDGATSVTPFSAAFLQSAVTLFSGAFIAFLLVHRGKRFLSIFRSRALTFFGLISYALYMTHTYILEVYDHMRGLPQLGDLRSYVLRLGTILVATIVVSLLSRYLLELPAASLRKYVLLPSGHAGRRSTTQPG